MNKKTVPLLFRFISPAITTILYILVFSACTSFKHDVTPAIGKIYHSISLRVSVKDQTTNKKQTFKILLKFDENRDKMLFLSPINQVYGQLFIQQEKSLLINNKKKRYWQGQFNILIDTIWALDFQYAEFKELIMTGKIPAEKINQDGMAINVEMNETKTAPVRIQVVREEMVIQLKISEHKTGEGLIDFSPRLAGMKKTDIETVLSE